ARGHGPARRRPEPRPLAGHAGAAGPSLSSSHLRAAGPATAGRGADQRRRRGHPDVPRAVRGRAGRGRGELGRGVPGRERPAARARRQAARPDRQLAGRAERRRLRRGPARAAADLRRVRAARAAGDRRAGGSPGRQRPGAGCRGGGQRRARRGPGSPRRPDRGGHPRAWRPFGCGGRVMSAGQEERMRRWRLVLGGADDGTGTALGGVDARVDAALSALYDSDEADGGGGTRAGGRRGSGLGASAPRVARWLGDIRTFFPVSVVQVMQKDAIERLGLTRLLLEPEMLDAVEPDVHLVGTLLSLSRVIPEQARESARAVVRAVTRDLERRLAQRTRSAVDGALNRASRTSRPRRPADIDWDRTIRAKLRNYQPSHRP